MEKEVDFSNGTYKNFYSSFSSFLNFIFISIVNIAEKTLASVASISTSIKITQKYFYSKWKPIEHFQFILMLLSWVALWFLRVLMDHFPSFSNLLIMSTAHNSSIFDFIQEFSPMGFNFDLSQSSLLPSSLSSSDLLLNNIDGADDQVLPIKALTRALSHVLTLLNEIPTTSPKYQFVMAIAEKIMDDNSRSGHMELLQINRIVLASAFVRTTTLLQQSLESFQKDKNSFTWVSRSLQTLPYGSYLAPYLKGLSFCIGVVHSLIKTAMYQSQKKTPSRVVGGEGIELLDREVEAEKLGEEMVWITNKLRVYGGVEEALLQWSTASNLACFSLAANLRAQSLIVKTAAILVGDMNREDIDISREVKLRILMVWIPLLCHATNGILTCLEKAEIERNINEAILSLPPTDQELILNNWLRDFAISYSDSPNLQLSYDRWCQFTRNLVIKL